MDKREVTRTGYYCVRCDKELVRDTAREVDYCPGCGMTWSWDKGEVRGGEDQTR